MSLTRSPPDEPFKVFIHCGELAQIRQWVLAHESIETGGDLFGLWSDENSAVVHFVLGPGEGSKRTEISFFQNVEYLRDVGSMLSHRHGLCHVGEWHSHHRLDLAQPSKGDKATVANNMPTYEWKRFIMFITNIPYGTVGVAGIGCFLFEVHDSTKDIRMRQGEIEMIASQSPFREFLGFSQVFKDVVTNRAELMNEKENVEVKKSITYLLSFAPADRGVPLAEFSRSLETAETVGERAALETNYAWLWRGSFWHSLRFGEQAFFETAAKYLNGFIAREPHSVTILFPRRIPVGSSQSQTQEFVETYCRLEWRQNGSCVVVALNTEKPVLARDIHRDFLHALSESIQSIVAEKRAS